MRNKRILFISPVFFDYYKEIIKELKKNNYDVDYICDAPSNSNIFKAINRINKNLTKKRAKKYYLNSILPDIKEKKYDYILVIVGMTFSIPIEMVEKLRDLNKGAKFIIYQWDGEKNIEYIKEYHKFFDRVYSFDRFDCEKNEMYNFLPLFYINQYEEIGKIKSDKYKYDVSYIGTAHPQKYKMINEMSEALKAKLPRQFIYHYLPSKLKFYYHKFKAKEYKKAKLNNFNFEKVSVDKMTRIFKESRCVFDAPQFGQSGLTIRTIECLGAKKKLITANKDIKNYDFYCEENILIYDENFDCNSKFFTENYKELPKEIYNKYSLRSWIKYILKN